MKSNNFVFWKRVKNSSVFNVRGLNWIKYFESRHSKYCLNLDLFGFGMFKSVLLMLVVLKLKWNVNVKAIANSIKVNGLSSLGYREQPSIYIKLFSFRFNWNHIIRLDSAVANNSPILFLSKCQADSTEGERGGGFRKDHSLFKGLFWL